MKETASQNDKMFYRISEVADMLGVNISLLRYWEEEFPQITPKKNKRGVRYYTKEDIHTINLIYHLVKEKGMTLSGAKQKLKYNKDAAEREHLVIEKLKRIREELKNINKMMNGEI